MKLWFAVMFLSMVPCLSYAQEAVPVAPGMPWGALISFLVFSVGVGAWTVWAVFKKGDKDKDKDQAKKD